MEIDSQRPPIKPQTEPQTGQKTKDQHHQPSSWSTFYFSSDPLPHPDQSIVAICRRIGQRPWTMQIEFQWRAIIDAWLKFAIRVLSLARKQSQSQIAIT